jgi:hypothetical protein
VNDELQRRITEHVLNGDAPSIIWAMEAQIRINTKLEAKLAELERREALLTAVVVARRKWLACTRLPEQDALLEELHAADDALTDAGFPWEQPK